MDPEGRRPCLYASKDRVRVSKPTTLRTITTTGHYGVDFRTRTGGECYNRSCSRTYCLVIFLPTFSSVPKVTQRPTPNQGSSRVCVADTVRPHLVVDPSLERQVSGPPFGAGVELRPFLSSVDWDRDPRHPCRSEEDLKPLVGDHSLRVVTPTPPYPH